MPRKLALLSHSRPCGAGAAVCEEVKPKGVLKTVQAVTWYEMANHGMLEQREGNFRAPHVLASQSSVSLQAVES